MAKMNVPLTPEQLKKLIELAYLGEWMINAHHDNDFQDDAADDVLQKLMSLAEMPEVEQDIETQQYYLTADWADRLYDQYILDYDDHVFWDELTERLAQRDLARQRRVPMEQINREDDLLALRPLEERYRRDWDQHGIERLELTDDF